MHVIDDYDLAPREPVNQSRPGTNELRRRLLRIHPATLASRAPENIRPPAPQVAATHRSTRT
jgi:hypothetical protein